jgi:hypothetical protein
MSGKLDVCAVCVKRTSTWLSMKSINVDDSTSFPVFDEKRQSIHSVSSADVISQPTQDEHLPSRKRISSSTTRQYTDDRYVIRLEATSNVDRLLLNEGFALCSIGRIQVGVIEPAHLEHLCYCLNS